MTQESQKHLPRYKIGYQSDEWGMGGRTPTGIPSPDGAWVRYEDAQAVATGYAAARLEIESLQARAQELVAQLDAVGAGGVEPLRRAKCLHQIEEPQHSAKYPPINPEDFDSDSDLCHYFYAWKYAKAGDDSGEKWQWACGRIQRMMRAYVDASHAMLSVAPQPPAPVRQPLTDDEIESLYGDSNFDVTGPYVIAFARAIEAAHGITAPKPLWLPSDGTEGGAL